MHCPWSDNRWRWVPYCLYEANLQQNLCLMCGDARSWAGTNIGTIRILPRQVIAQAQHQPAKQPGRRHLAQRFATGIFATAAPRRRRRDDPQNASENPA
jgi:hypothetical protein